MIFSFNFCPSERLMGVDQLRSTNLQWYFRQLKASNLRMAYFLGDLSLRLSFMIFFSQKIVVIMLSSSTISAKVKHIEIMTILTMSIFFVLDSDIVQRRMIGTVTSRGAHLTAITLIIVIRFILIHMI